MKKLARDFIMIAGVSYIMYNFFDSEIKVAFQVLVKALIFSTLVVFLPWLFDLLRKRWKQRREETV